MRRTTDKAGEYRPWGSYKQEAEEDVGVDGAVPESLSSGIVSCDRGIRGDEDCSEDCADAFAGMSRISPWPVSPRRWDSPSIVVVLMIRIVDDSATSTSSLRDSKLFVV